jgi:hypothetical protein
MIEKNIFKLKSDLVYDSSLATVTSSLPQALKKVKAKEIIKYIDFIISNY